MYIDKPWGYTWSQEEKTGKVWYCKIDIGTKHSHMLGLSQEVNLLMVIKWFFSPPMYTCLMQTSLAFTLDQKIRVWRELSTPTYFDRVPCLRKSLLSLRGKSKIIQALDDCQGSVGALSTVGSRFCARSVHCCAPVFSERMSLRLINDRMRDWMLHIVCGPIDDWMFGLAWSSQTSLVAVACPFLSTDTVEFQLKYAKVVLNPFLLSTY